MKNLFAINFAENTIVATKATLKKASIPNSPEYKTLMKLTKQNPAFMVVEKEIKKSESKKTYKGLNTVFIGKYLSIQENADELTRQYEKALELGKFSMARKWFLDTFKNFDMSAAKKELDAAFVAEVKASAAETERKIVDMPAAANF